VKKGKEKVCIRIIRTLHVHEYSNLTCTLITHIRVLYESLLIYAQKHRLIIQKHTWYTYPSERIDNILILPSLLERWAGSSLTLQKINGLINSYHVRDEVCFDNTSAGLSLPSIWNGFTISSATASLTRWKLNIFHLLAILPSDFVVLIVVDKLSPNMYVGPIIGTPKPRAV